MSRLFRWYSTVSAGSKVVALAAVLLAVTLALQTMDRAAGHRGAAVVGGGDRQTARQFQRMAGGLGLGATVRPRWCFVNFDPRLEHCTCAEQPLPGGYCYCPEHTGTVSFFDVEGPEALGVGEKGAPAP